VLFRVFLESSIDNYISSQLVPRSDQKQNRYTLSRKILDVCNFMEKNNIVGKSHLKSPRTMASEKHNVLSIDTLNAYVHNQHLSPTPLELKLSWDNISEFVEALWR
jgi:hypothetical protein